MQTLIILKIFGTMFGIGGSLPPLATRLVTVIETLDSFWKLVSKDRFPKMNHFALKMHSTFGNIYTFLVLKLFYSLNHFVGSVPEVASFLYNSP